MMPRHAESIPLRPLLAAVLLMLDHGWATISAAVVLAAWWLYDLMKQRPSDPVAPTYERPSWPRLDEAEYHDGVVGQPDDGKGEPFLPIYGAWIDAARKQPEPFQSVIGWASLDNTAILSSEVYWDGLKWCSVRSDVRVTGLPYWMPMPLKPSSKA